MKRIIAFLLVAVAGMANATTYYIDAEQGDDGNNGTSAEVGDAGVGPFQSLAWAVAKAADQDTLQFAKGTYLLTNNVETTIRGLTFKGATGNRDDVVFDGQGSFRFLRQNSVLYSLTTRCRDLTVRNSFTDSTSQSGAAISLATDALIISNCVIACCTNTGTYGSVASAVYSILVYDSLVTNNAATSKAYAFVHNGGGSGSRIVLYDSVFEENTALGSCFMNLGNGSWGNAYGCTFKRNRNLGTDNGGLFTGHMSVMSNCVFVANEALRVDGGVFATGNVSDHFQVMDCHFTNNIAGGGGGCLYYYNPLHLLRNCTFSGNVSRSGHGGAIYMHANNGIGRAENCEFVGNLATNNHGGALYGWVGDMANCRFERNIAKYAGGAWYYCNIGEGDMRNTTNSIAYYGYPPVGYTVSNCVFRQNELYTLVNTTPCGGAVMFSGTPACHPAGYTLGHCVFEGNAITNVYMTGRNYAEGGALCSVCKLTIEDCRFDRNLNSTWGSAAYVTAATRFARCSFTENFGYRDPAKLTDSGLAGSAPDCAYGTVMVWTGFGTEVAFDHCAFSNNVIRGPGGAAVASRTGDLNFRDCDFVGNVVSNYSGTSCYGGGAIAHIDHTTRTTPQSIKVERCRFVDNYLTHVKNEESKGGAISLRVNTTASRQVEGYIRNSLFVNNLCTNTYSAAKAAYGGAVFVPSLQGITFENDTFANNRTKTTGGALYLGGSTATNAPIVNCVFYGNRDGQSNTTTDDIRASGVNVISNSFAKTGGILTDGVNGCVVKDVNPFRTDDHCDYAMIRELRGLGQVLDWMTADSVDLGGKPRLTNGLVDFGCYQYWKRLGMVIILR